MKPPLLSLWVQKLSTKIFYILQIHWGDNMLLLIRLTHGRHQTNLTVTGARSEIQHICLSTKSLEHTSQEAVSDVFGACELTDMKYQQRQHLPFHPDSISHLIIQRYDSESKVISALIIQEESECRQPLQQKPELSDIPPLLPSSNVLQAASLKYVSLICVSRSMSFSKNVAMSSTLHTFLEGSNLLVKDTWEWALQNVTAEMKDFTKQ